jgi:hypothetical protein
VLSSSSDNTQPQPVLILTSNNEINNDSAHDSNNASMPYTNNDTAVTANDSLEDKTQISISSTPSTNSNVDDSSCSDSSYGNNSIYTTGTTMSHRNFTVGYDRTRSNKPICPGDVIQYYDPIYVTGDKQGLREARVLAVNHKDVVPLDLSNGEGIPRSCTLKQIKILKDNVLVDHSNSLFRSMDSFKLRTSGTARLSDVTVQ